MFSENTLLLYQQDLKLGLYFVKWQLSLKKGCYICNIMLVSKTTKT